MLPLNDVVRISINLAVAYSLGLGLVRKLQRCPEGCTREQEQDASVLDALN